MRRMSSKKWWALVALLAALSLTVTVHCTLVEEKVSQADTLPLEELDEGEDYSDDESEIDAPIKEYVPPPPPPGLLPNQGIYNQPILPPGPAIPYPPQQTYPQQQIPYNVPIVANATIVEQPPTYQEVPVPVPVAPVAPVAPVTYQPAAPAPVSYQPPAPAPATYQSAAPVQTPVAVQQPVVSTYQPSVPAQPVQINYSAPVVVQQNYSAPAGNYSQGGYNGGLTRYSIGDLAPFLPLTNYRANHWSLFYYRASPYFRCPKSAGPGYKDIEAAFVWAQAQLGQLTASVGTGKFMTSAEPSWAARHQVFSFISQQNARLDEEGLLLELVSRYLADRACLTKWDKQRYLPSLTKFISVDNFPPGFACSQLYQNQWQGQLKSCVLNKYRTYDGFCNNPYHPYWGKSNVCHIRLLSPDYGDGISEPRRSYNGRFPLPNPRLISNYIHHEVPLESPYNLMKMQWGQFINHDITNTALSAYEGLVDCCKNPGVRGCWPIYVPPGDGFYSPLNVTCLNFIRSGVCPTCQLGPRQQLNKNTAFLDASHVYGNTAEQARQLRAWRAGQLRFELAQNGEVILPQASNRNGEQCSGSCFVAGDSRVNQHPTLTALHVLLLRNHNLHAKALQARHPSWNDEYVFQEARRINIAEFQMITYNEYLPIVFGPILSAYYKLTPLRQGNTYYEPKADPTTWNEYSTASCRFGHSQISNLFGLYSQILPAGQAYSQQQTFRLKDWFMRPSFITQGLTTKLIVGLIGQPAQAVDPWVTNDVRNHLYQSHVEKSGGDLAATNIWRGRDHGIPGYVHYVEYCFNYKIRGWKDLQLFIPYYTLNQLRKVYKVVENIDLFTGGMSERHFPGADIGPTFACINGIQYYHLKFGDRFYFEHANQAGSFTPAQLDEIRKTTLAKLLCRTTNNFPVTPQYAFMAPSQYNPLVNCSQLGTFDYYKF